MELISTACIYACGITLHTNVSSAYERVGRIILFLKPFYTSHDHTNILTQLSLMHNQCEFIIESMTNMTESLNIFSISTITYSNTTCEVKASSYKLKTLFQLGESVLYSVCV